MANRCLLLICSILCVKIVLLNAMAIVELSDQDQAFQKSNYPNLHAFSQRHEAVSATEMKAKRMIGFKIPSLEYLNRLKMQSSKIVREESPQPVASKDATATAVARHSFFNTVKQLYRLGGSHAENPLKVHYIIKEHRLS